MSRRQKLVNLLRDISGLTAMHWLMRSPGLYCFNYHRIGSPQTTEFDPNVISCTSERFEQHIAFLKKHFKLVNIATLVKIQQQEKAVDKPLALVTFDDGYRDNYYEAFPILKKHRVPAVFFVSTQHIDGNLLFWWDHVAWMVRYSRSPEISLPGSDNKLILANQPPALTIRKLLKAIKQDKQHSLEQKLQQLAEETGTHSEAPPGSYAMDWQMLQEMQAAGMDIGSHTCSHQILSHLSVEEQRNELQLSKQIMEEKLQKPVEAFAYPVGGRDAYTEQTRQLLAEVGYKLAFNYIGYANANLRHRYEIGRLPVDDNIPVNSLRRQIAFAPIRGAT